jgi:curved DNA-binding protein CbpA
MPRTREDALHFLGMGVSSDASLTAIKKIVDGLRLSWHPDYASGAADREVRELRTKQINAAWDIIKGKRAAA